MQGRWEEPVREAAPTLTPTPSMRASARLAAAANLLLHPLTPTERPWKHLPLLLALAFAVRAAVALSGDFVLHPDEIMQYLEPAHRLVFGNGAAFWEYLYGARSWLVPGLVAGVLALFDALGLGEPAWYVGAVKLLFCVMSLAIPAGMYFFARVHFSETAARAALLAGAFWYELVGFAHKPMTEFVATALFVALLALCVRPMPDRSRMPWALAFLAVLAAAIRMQYAPLALIVLGLYFLRTRHKLRLTLAATALLAAVGLFDAITWDAGLFHSYILNFRFNLAMSDLKSGESPVWLYLWWLLLSGTGLAVLSVLLGLRNVRRYGFLLGLIVLTVVIHSTQPHREYRFIFVVVPLWLMIGTDVAVRFASNSRVNRMHVLGAAAAVAGAVAAAGILNVLPYQSQVYRGFSLESGVVGFVRNQDPVFAAYRYLARAPGVAGVFHERSYMNTPGYYYLHRKVPLYVGGTSSLLFADPNLTALEAITSSVTHIVTADAAMSVPGYSLDRSFGYLRILRRDVDEPVVRQWVHYTPTFDTGIFGRIARQLYPIPPPFPANAGIRFVDDVGPSTEP